MSNKQRMPSPGRRLLIADCSLTHSLFDQMEYFVAPRLAGSRRKNCSGQFFPSGQQHLLVLLHVFLQFISLQLIDFCEDECYWNFPTACPFNKIEINSLRLQPGVDENEETRKTVTFRHIVFNNSSEACS